MRAPLPASGARRGRLLAPIVLLAGVLVAAIVIVVLLLSGGEDEPPPAGVPAVPTPPGVEAGPQAKTLPDPFAWDPAHADQLEARAATGASNVLYRLSPGGAEASAQRTERWRPRIEDAAEEADVDADTLEALVFLESAGREDALTPAGTEGAAGLTQIVAETGQNLLGMRVDVPRSRRFTRRIDRDLRRGRIERVGRLRRERRRVDERFDPVKALAATARYLTLAKRRVGTEQLAFVSYHMGIGNLQGVLRAFGGGEDLDYAQVYFDSTPLRHAAAYERLSRLGDDSSNYWWKLQAAREIMRLYREDRDELRALAAQHTAKNSAEEVLQPPSSTPRFATPQELRAAWDRDEIVPFVDRPRVTGLRRQRRMGELAERVRQPRGLYRGLRPEAMAMALYIGAQVRAISGTSPLTVTSTVRDEAYQRLLVRRNSQATRNFSLHTTGWAFDVLRSYRSRAQARAFQFVLDRLQILNAIAWVREPGAIHITVSRDARSLLPLLDRIR